MLAMFLEGTVYQEGILVPIVLIMHQNKSIKKLFEKFEYNI